MTHEWTREMTSVRNQQARVHVRLWQLLVLRSCDRWAKTTSLSPLLVSDCPEQRGSLFTGGHATVWTLKNVQCFYKNAHFLVFYISSTTKMIFSVGPEGGTKAWALDLTLKIIHTNSCPIIWCIQTCYSSHMLLWLLQSKELCSWRTGINPGWIPPWLATLSHCIVHLHFPSGTINWEILE